MPPTSRPRVSGPAGPTPTIRSPRCASDSNSPWAVTERHWSTSRATRSGRWRGARASWWPRCSTVGVPAAITRAWKARARGWTTTRMHGARWRPSPAPVSTKSSRWRASPRRSTCCWRRSGARTPGVTASSWNRRPSRAIGTRCAAMCRHAASIRMPASSRCPRVRTDCSTPRTSPPPARRRAIAPVCSSWAA